MRPLSQKHTLKHHNITLMKKSTILIITLLAFSFVAMMASNVAIKKQFDEIDPVNPYHGFERHNLTKFSYVKLAGNYYGVTQIEYGKDNKILTAKLENGDKSPVVTWSVKQDTLFVNYNWNAKKIPYFEHWTNISPNVIIKVPALNGLDSDGIFTRIKDQKSQTFALQQRGMATSLSNNEFEDFTAQVSQGAKINIFKTNKLSAASLLLSDSTSFISEDDSFGTLSMKTDSNVKIQLPAKTLKKIKYL